MSLSHRKLEELIMKKSLKESSKIEKLVLMEVQLLNEEITYLEFLHEEGNRLKSMGHSREVVNEEISKMFGSMLDKGLDGAIDSIKALILDSLLSAIGLNPKQPGGWGLLGCAISNTLEELDIATFKKIFGDASSGYTEAGLQGIWPNICDELTDFTSNSTPSFLKSSTTNASACVTDTAFIKYVSVCHLTPFGVSVAILTLTT